MGQWIRFYALAPSPARRRLAGALGTTDARNGTASARPNNSSRDSDGVLPLTAALERQLAMGQLYAEAELAPEGVVSAARPGTLDAYLCELALVPAASCGHSAALGFCTRPGAAALGMPASCCAFPSCARRWGKSGGQRSECVRGHGSHQISLSVSCVQLPPTSKAGFAAAQSTLISMHHFHAPLPGRVVAKGDNWVELERPLPYDLRTEWNVRGVHMGRGRQRLSMHSFSCKDLRLALCDRFPFPLHCRSGCTTSIRQCSTRALKASQFRSPGVSASVFACCALGELRCWFCGCLAMLRQSLTPRLSAPCRHLSGASEEQGI